MEVHYCCGAQYLEEAEGTNSANDSVTYKLLENRLKKKKSLFKLLWTEWRVVRVEKNIPKPFSVNRVKLKSTYATNDKYDVLSDNLYSTQVDLTLFCHVKCML